jgi:hypothetical protein
VLREQAGQLLLVHVGARGDEVGGHDVAHRAIAGSGEQLAQRHHPDQLALRVVHVDVVDVLELLARLLAQVADRLVHVDVGAHVRVARVHEAAGVVLGVGEQRHHLAAGLLVQQREQRLALVLAGLLHQVGGVVGGQEPHPGAPLLGRDRVDHLVLVTRGELEEEVLGLGPWQLEEGLQPVVRGQQPPALAQVVGREAGLALGFATEAHGPRSWPATEPSNDERYSV